jgi:tetrahydromethanopterin S-methyltransferase subunit C
MVILILIIVSVGISFLGLGALSPESMKELSLNMENLSGSISLTIRGINFILTLISPLQAGLIKWLMCRRDEEFHVSTVFSYYTTKYFSQIFIAT